MPRPVMAARLIEGVVDAGTVEDPIAVLDLLQALNKLRVPWELPPLNDTEPPPADPAEQLEQARALLRSAVSQVDDPRLVRQLGEAIRSLDSALQVLALTSNLVGVNRLTLRAEVRVTDVLTGIHP